MRALAFLFLTFLLAGSAAADALDPCDALAANPPDPDRVTVGVPRSEVDLPAAIEACEKAVTAHPDVARFVYQLGRVQFYNGDTQKAVVNFRKAADLGYRQAWFILGALINNRREGVDYDACKIEEYWLKSARLGHITARVSYVRHVTKGYFDDCPVHATADELRDFIDIEAQAAEDYYLRLLVEDLKPAVETYAGSHSLPTSD